jgi:RimJ/RimL family protein N-acetyltransferase
MKVVIAEPQDALIAWLCSRINYVPTPNMVCFGQYDTAIKQLVAVVGYDNWSAASVEMHVASDLCSRWMTRELLYKCFSYPFERGGVNTVLGKTGSDNEAAIRLNTHLGFKEVVRIPHAWKGGEDMVIFAMQHDECKWLKLADKQQVRAA